MAHVVDDLTSKGAPYWNGEDIYHSLVALKITGKLHTTLPLNYKEYKLLPSPYGICDNKLLNHTSYRKMSMREDVKCLGIDVCALRSES